jgi:MoxR-like ATPase
LNFNLQRGLIIMSKINASQKLQLAKLPFGALNEILLNEGVPVKDTKQSALDMVVTLIENGTLSLTDALATTKSAPTVPSSTLAFDTSAFEDEFRTLREDIANLKTLRGNDAISSSISLENFRNAFIKSMDDQHNAMNDNARILQRGLNDDIAKLQQAVTEAKQTKVDTVAVERTLQAEVAKVFSTFKQSTPVEQLAVIASAVPVFELKMAKDVFDGSLSYRLDGKVVDFSKQMVAVWNDPNAPLRVDDYNFNPEHLHQTLCALDGALPDNLWLGGERGTGKTEFVTQVASRLGRRLFKVSFDEAMERSEFIGGNTIKDGSVVWQDGIIAQAIKYCGAVVLLDEIGFARSQNLASLHAVLERSPHRALVINETGLKIPVASHVVFFCADNSNGHGDASGNFQGVREQNSAFIDRFSYTLMFQYLPFAEEVELVANRTGLPLEATKVLVKFANVAREKAKLGVLTQPPSLRQVFAWARGIQRGVPVSIAFTNAIVNKFPFDCEADLRGIYSAVVDESALKSFLTN